MNTEHIVNLSFSHLFCGSFSLSSCLSSTTWTYFELLAKCCVIKFVSNHNHFYPSKQ